jgi:TerC family integral membrane protein
VILIVLLSSIPATSKYTGKEGQRNLGRKIGRGHERPSLSNGHKSYPRETPLVLAKALNREVQGDDEAAIKKQRKDLQTTYTWMGTAFAFAGFIYAFQGSAPAVEFLSGYFLEMTLSVDNLIVFLILFDYFKVDKAAEERILSWGLGGAIVMRAFFIGIGTVAIEKFKQINLLFATVLLYSSLKILFKGGEEKEEDPADSHVVKFAKKYLRTTEKREGTKFFTYIDGVKHVTPLFLCLVCVELSDVLFAFDSVPAIFGVTNDPFIVLTSNIFAIAGLRSLYGVLSRAVDELKYLDKAVGIVLVIIAAKLGAETFNIHLLTPLKSLGVVIGVLGTGIVASILDKRKETE